MPEKAKVNGNLALSQKKVIVIDAAGRPETEKLRVAAYCRVSSDSSDQLNSFMAQLNYYTTLINSQDTWMLADIYADEGITGTSVEKRPDFQRLISDCRKGQIDKILVKSISRFARNTTDCLTIIRELKSIGVGVCFEEQNIDTSKMSGELLTAVFAGIAQKESESISGNMRWSYKRRMENGTYVPSVLPYGYIRIDGKIEIDEKRANVIRQIFSWYLSGHSADMIADILNAKQIPSRYGGVRWSQTAVRYILTNEKYAGNSLWQKYYTTDTLPYQHPRNRGQRESYYAESTHEAIVSMEDFTATQELMAKRRKVLTPEQNIPSSFRKKLYCGECGTLFRRKTIRGVIYWACMGHDKKGNDFCPVTQIPEHMICEAFLRFYYKLKSHGEDILTQMLVDLQAIREHRMLWSEDVIELNKQISDLSDQNRMLASMNQAGLVDPDLFISQSNSLASQLQSAKQEKDRLIGARDDDTIVQTRTLLEELDAMPDFLPAFNSEIFEILVEKITVEHGGLLRLQLKNGLRLTEPLERRP
mgnify:FL=1